MESTIADTSKGKIEYTLLGRGPVVLVCHGTSANCFSVESFQPLIEAGFSVLTPSRPGYGRTPLKTGVTAAQSAEAMIALLDILKIDTCAVIGVSGGGPTAIALAAGWPERIRALVLLSAISKPETRPDEPLYKNQASFYGPMHSLAWAMLGLNSRLSPKGMARQTMAIFSTHDPADAFRQLSPEDIQQISRFYQNSSSRQGALNDWNHTVGKGLLQKITVPTLVVHSREDAPVPFTHAEWSLANIAGSRLVESGVTGHFFWVGPDYPRVAGEINRFLLESLSVRTSIK